jgi:uncharacterized protein (TIGR03437 family)
MLHRSLLWALALTSLMLTFVASGQTQAAGPRALITRAIDEHSLVTLSGNTRPEAKRQKDLGAVADDLHLDMYLQLKRSPDRELAAQQFVESLTDKTSPNFHKWITAAEYGERFGAAAEDIATVSRWLESHGFTVNAVPANRMVIDFSGTSGQVREALHTEIHSLDVAGKRYFANMSDPRIPAALVPAVSGVVSLSNIMPQPMYVERAQFTASSNEYPIVPGDLATIYNLAPAFAGGFSGQGQTIVVVEDTDLYKGTADWNTFRSVFGLSQYAQGSLTEVHPVTAGGGTACSDPGVNGDDVEAAIDVEWASAAAPNAAIVNAACMDTTNFGGFIALQNIVNNGGELPSVVSISYGESETQAGAAFNSYINTLYQTAAAVGVSVFVSSGDAAAAPIDRDGHAATMGIGVSAFASTPYNVAVGGTDFSDFASGTTLNFWNASNGIYDNSAKSYVPEIPWNDSCGGSVTASYYGFGTSDGTTAFCNAYPSYTETIGAGGGPSGCATGAQDIVYAVSGTCAGYPKPSWQSIFGNPSDGVRDLPDVSLFASNGFWGHYYEVCLGCTAQTGWSGYGGTSVSSPIMAGIQALINQALGTTNVGNPNPVYYQIAQTEYSTSAGRAACNSTNGPASTCSFNDITEGDIVLPCAGVIDCYTAGYGIGLLSTSNTSFEPAYAATPGWDFATGIGSVNAFNLLNAFVDSVIPTGAPAAPKLASPANGATGVLPNASLAWNASSGATSYDVYFGTSNTPPLVTNTADITYTPGALAAGTTYYWAIGARNSLGANASGAWSFTTSCVASLNPSSATVGAAGGAKTIPVIAGNGCGWTIESNVPWISITSGSFFSGSGTVSYTVAVDTGATRSGTLSIAGQTFTVTQAGIYPLITTLAGGAMPPTAAPGASLSIPVSYDGAIDASGNVYFASPSLNAVFKADPSGVVTRVAGTGVAGMGGNGGPALQAQLTGPQSVALDAEGNLYVADSGNLLVKKVDTSGNISTVAGDNNWGYTGDGGPATAAQIGFPWGVAVGPSGNLYISDILNDVVREVSPSGTISTVAGNGSFGYSGDGATATSAQLSLPEGLAADASGNLYIADTVNQRVRMVSTAGIITTVAGNGIPGYSGDGGPATSAKLWEPTDVAVDAAGDLFIADESNSRVRKVAAGGTITTVAGSGSQGYSGDGAGATGAQFNGLCGLALDNSGNLYIMDCGNQRIREVAAGIVTTFVGGGINDGGLGVFANLNQPTAVARDNAGNTYVADPGNNRIRKVAADGTIATIAGTGITGSSGDGAPAANAQLNAPRGVALDASGNLYIADTGNFRIRKMDASGNISTVAGSGTAGYSGDGASALKARIGYIYGLALDAAGNLYIADVTHNVVRKVTAAGAISTVAGTGIAGYSGDGAAATKAQLNGPYDVAVDTAGNLYIADYNNNCVRIVSKSGTITTFAGTGTAGYSGDGGAAASAQLFNPSGVAVDTAGNLYIADTGNSLIRMVSSSGVITTVAGNGTYAYTGDGGLATAAALDFPSAVAVDATGNVAVADQSNNAIRLLIPSYSVPVFSIQSTHTGNFAQGQTGATYTLSVSNSLGAAPSSGTVTVGEILPTGFALASMAGAGWTCAGPTCTRSDALNGGSSYPAITVTVNVAAAAPAQLTNQASVSGGGANTAARSTDLTLIGSSTAPAAPSIASGGIVPVDSTVAAIQPGEWVSIYGANLAGSTTIWNQNFPTSLGGTGVTIDGKDAYLWYVSPGQINLQVPDDTVTGSVPVVVTTAGGSATATVTLAQSSPSFLLLDGKHVTGIILRPDGSGAYGAGAYDILGPTGKSLGYPTVAAKAGDTVELFGTGFGPTRPAVAAGHAFSGAAAATSPVSLLVNGVTVTPLFAGLSAAGLDQINLTIPPGLGTGDVPLVAAVGGVQTSSGVVISLQ